MPTTDVFVNLAQSTLASGINNSVTSLTLATGDGAKFSSPGASQQGRLIIGTEIILFTTRSSDTLSGLTRGAESTTAASHSTGDVVAQVVTAGIATEFVQNPMAALGSLILGGSAGVPTELTVGSTGQVPTVSGGTLAYATPTLPGLSIYGDGSDGTVTISGNTTLARDMFYDVLTVNAGIVLSTGGFRIFCKTSATVNGTISRAATNASNNTAGGALPAATLGGSSAGGAGQTGAGTSGTALSTLAQGGSGGGGGAGTPGAASSGGTASFATTTRVPARAFPYTLGMDATGAQYTGGAGGGGGGGDGTNSGGGGGGGAGVVMIVAKSLTVGGAGVISANGGNGATRSTGNVGGGGGGGGGLLLIVTNSYSNSGTVQAAGGTKGNGVGTGANGVDGSAGLALVLLNT